MSENINQIYIANPITSNTSTDLMYFGQSPYGINNDAAMTYANFSAQFSGPSPLTTKGDLYTFSTVNTRLAVGTTNGQILQVASGAATGLAWSTAAYPLVATSTGSFIYANGANFVASTSLWPNTVGTSGKIVISNGSANIYSTPTYPNAAGTSGNVITSDGTNFVSSSSAGIGSPLTTKGDIYAYSTTNARFPVAVGDGKILQVSSGATFGIAYSTPTYPSASGSAGQILRSDGTNNVYSTSTFADTYSVSTILYASGSNAVSGLATSNQATLVTGATGIPAWQAMSAGQILVGTTAGAPTATAINSGTGILVANGSGSITVSAAAGSGINSWIAAASTPITAAINTGYYITDASQVTITLPTTAAAGSVVGIVGNGAGGWVLAPGAGQTIKVIGSSASTSITSAEQYDCIEVLCVVANTTWVARSLLSTGLTIS